MFKNMNMQMAKTFQNKVLSLTIICMPLVIVSYFFEFYAILKRRKITLKSARSFSNKCYISGKVSSSVYVYIVSNL